MKRIVTVAVIALAQLVLVGVAVAPQLSARVAGESHLVRVAPLDPIDPYRGAYVSLDYPDLQPPPEGEVADDTGLGALDDGETGAVYITLRQDGDVWVADRWLRERPSDTPYLACDDRSWEVRCGIESWFLPQEKAQALEADLADGAYAEIRVDGRGNTALVDVREHP
ncbi:GDYXXLXY domain-containing protein [Janibacter alittae]|uniref:GDYXXLXY domain-containing protein n=1 Tax=Janibacter alittae TaxID=3115209 RepID=A0ABZ2MJZ4_9MICO